ncbi:MAG TPA: DUF1801 domain-containing protein [Leptospiraceae bacterium]|nr:DUF1801 domain-containing protein [Leptospiraceae bacterium]HMW06611.1 DUF1801 domain-containing protein [Leptospiraceae bacterium]HMX32039.1 DUF1801 domain-containing protein [Leptospiraceae bacterium]HMY31198.1 DUF1801 domain-containing protein [Leptospiraceae bacterium]HMZ63315.1 DUF1801 domain-containing protein [Leptospiraceae bacterium]
MNEIDKYIKKFPAEVGKKVAHLREIVKKVAPKAKEVYEHKVIAFTIKDDYLIWYGVYRNRLCIFPKSETIEKFRSELDGIIVTKGTIEFQASKPLPVDLITRILKYRLKELSKSNQDEK